ncbi:hypothetical protein STCU_04012 [Strigomonas culicis]|uniref:Uncharacterized protein n=1 Tax=Strigomonas culicis TaxID=28005 RepID=S9UIA3_9TRYP|nr:hypothetical protein STCU_04012 [Strigomonas culicis]|eukprot:EPY30547.1 hypothetical protein STCU_04012 [Strigomonas culicis]
MEKYEHDYHKHPVRCFLYGWPLFLSTLALVVWFVYTSFECLFRYTIVHDEDYRLVDRNFYFLCLPTLALMAFSVFFLPSFIGWKFFRHN